MSALGPPLNPDTFVTLTWMSPPRPPLSPDTLIHLTVDERVFVTLPATLLRDSRTFEKLINDREENAPPELRMFLDLDPDVFAHVLEYLRSGVFPLFYDKSRGYNYNLYDRLLAQARFLQMPRLMHWLERKLYLSAITSTRWVKEVPMKDMITERIGGDEDVEFQTHVRSMIICPRNIRRHLEYPSTCGQDCDNFRKQLGKQEEWKDFTVVTVIRTKVIYQQMTVPSIGTL